MTHHAADPVTGLRPMTYGRAMKMDLSRASDLDLDRAYRVLDEYDTAGKASAYTQMEIDDRLDDINAEGDRRAGVEPAYVPRLPREHYFPKAEADDADAPASPAGEVEPASPESLRTARDASVDGLVPGETSAI